MPNSCKVDRLAYRYEYLCDACAAPTKEFFELEFTVRRLELCLPCFCGLKTGMREMIGRSYNPIPDPNDLRITRCNTPAEGRDVAKPRTQQVGSVDRALDEEYEQWLREHPEEV